MRASPSTVRVDARRLFGRERQQVDRLALRATLGGVEPAREQHLLDQRIELGDIGVDLALAALALRRASRSSSIETAIFMRASGERSSWLALASSDWCDCTSASTRAAATLKLVATAATSSWPLTATRWLQLAGAELLDAALQRLEPARQPAHHRIGAGGDRDEQDHQHDDQADAALPPGGRSGSGGGRGRPASRPPARPGARRPARAGAAPGA